MQNSKRETLTDILTFPFIVQESQLRFALPHVHNFVRIRPFEIGDRLIDADVSNQTPKGERSLGDAAIFRVRVSRYTGQPWNVGYRVMFLPDNLYVTMQKSLSWIPFINFQQTLSSVSHSGQKVTSIAMHDVAFCGTAFPFRELRRFRLKKMYVSCDQKRRVARENQATIQKRTDENSFLNCLLRSLARIPLKANCSGLRISRDEWEISIDIK